MATMFASMTTFDAICTLHMIRDVISYFIREKFISERDWKSSSSSYVSAHVSVGEFPPFARRIIHWTWSHPANFFIFSTVTEITYLNARKTSFSFSLLFSENGLVTVTFTLSIYKTHRESGLVRPCSGTWFWQDDGCIWIYGYIAIYIFELLDESRWIRTSYVEPINCGLPFIYTNNFASVLARR